MKLKTNLTAVFTPDEEGGYIAYIEEIPGINTQGETLEEAKINLLDAFEMVLEQRRKMAKEEMTQNPKRKIIRERLQLI
jgi:predicted RNase H-like HicB family nuclease